MLHDQTPRPRQYAQQILALETKEERRAALEQVPAHLREMVRTQVEIAWEQKNGPRPD